MRPWQAFRDNGVRILAKWGPLTPLRMPDFVTIQGLS